MAKLIVSFLSELPERLEEEQPCNGGLPKDDGVNPKAQVTPKLPWCLVAGNERDQDLCNNYAQCPPRHAIRSREHERNREQGVRSNKLQVHRDINLEWLTEEHQ